MWDLGTGTAVPYAVPRPLYLRDGAVIEQVVDLHVPGPISDWGQVRSYNSRVEGAEALGGKWLNGNVDYQLIQEGMYNVSVIVDATSKRLFTYTYQSNKYASAGDATLTVEHDFNNSLFILTDWTTGAVNIFHDFYMYSPHPGKLKEKTTLAWRKAGKTACSTPTTASHQLTQITTADGQDYNIVFSYTNSRITKIELRTGADTSHPRAAGGLHVLRPPAPTRRTWATDGDLVQVHGQRTQDGWQRGHGRRLDRADQQYRYGSNGLLKSVFDPDAIAAAGRRPRGYRRRGRHPDQGGR